MQALGCELEPEILDLAAEIRGLPERPHRAAALARAAAALETEEARRGAPGVATKRWHYVLHGVGVQCNTHSQWHLWTPY